MPFWSCISPRYVPRGVIQHDQNMMIPELSGIHVHFSFEVSSYSGQAVCTRNREKSKKKRDSSKSEPSQ